MLALVDSDPYGLKILSVYMKGALLSHRGMSQGRTLWRGWAVTIMGMPLHQHVCVHYTDMLDSMCRHNMQLEWGWSLHVTNASDLVRRVAQAR